MSWTRCSVNGGRVAPARCAHSSAYCSKTNSVYIFGGWDGTNVLDDLVQFHVETSSWQFPLTCGKKPSRRAGHSGVALNEHTMLVFGGIEGEFYTSEVHTLDVETMEWKEIKTSGNIPQPRSRHSATVVGSCMYIYGGSDSHTTFNSLYCLDMTTMRWSIPNCKGTPPPSWGHGAVYHRLDNSIYYFGGNSSNPSATTTIGSDTSSYNNLSILNLNNLTWSININQINNEEQDNNNNSSKEDKKDIVTSRVGHTFTVYNNKFILFGGAGEQGKILNDTFVLDPTTLGWKQFAGDNTPTFRCSHTAEVVGHQIFMFGGSDGKRYFKDIAILDADKVLIKIDQEPKKKRIRLRPFKSLNSTNNNDEKDDKDKETNKQQQQQIKEDIKQEPVKQQEKEKEKEKEKEVKEVPVISKPVEIIKPIIKSIPITDLKPPIVQSSNSNSNSTTPRGVGGPSPKTSSHSTPSSPIKQAPPPLPQNPMRQRSASINISNMSSSSSNGTNHINSNNRPHTPTLIQSNNGFQIYNNTTSPKLSSSTSNNIIPSPRTTTPPTKLTISEWLIKNNLSKYESNFLDNDITIDILEYVTEQHLVDDLKIPTLGARLKILNAIQLQKDHGSNGTYKKREKDEKELLRDAIESFKSTSDSLAAAILSINSLSLASSASHSSSSPHINNSHHHPSPSFNSNNHRMRSSSGGHH